MGFFTTRIVDAQTDEAATTVAMDLIRKELAAQGIENDANRPIALSLDEVFEVDDLDPSISSKGFTFYDDADH
jgi:hypothetical protein